MNQEKEILERDLTILEKMTAEIPSYLGSEETEWHTLGEDMPKLTLGGCLMRHHRLMSVRNSLTEEERERLDKALVTFADLLQEKVVRFENHAHKEVHARIGEWIRHLQHLRGQKEVDVDEYADVVDTRVVISALITKLSSAPYQLDRRVLEEVGSLDRNLRNRWETGEFVWPAVWKLAYPADVYWWLYGRLRSFD